MYTIWKYPLKVIDKQIIKMPQGVRILTVQVQNGEPCLWAEVDPDNELQDVLIATRGTGNKYELSAASYIGTYQLRGDALVFHVFY